MLHDEFMLLKSARSLTRFCAKIVWTMTLETRRKGIRLWTPGQEVTVPGPFRSRQR